MAKRTVTHFKVGAKLFNDITELLLQLPAVNSRVLLNRIESKAECEVIYKVNLALKKPPRQKKTRKKVAKSKRRS